MDLACVALNETPVSGGLWGSISPWVRASQVAVVKNPACQCWGQERRGFDLWVGKIPWRRVWQPTPAFLPGESPWTEEPDGYSP